MKRVTKPAKRAKADEVVVVRPSTKKKKTVIPQLKVNDLTQYEDGSIWRIEHVTKSSADARCVVGGQLSGNVPGRLLSISTSAVGHRLVSAETLEQAKALQDVARKMCDRCWANHGDEKPCDIECWCHESKYQPRRRFEPSQEQVDRCVALRREGLGYAKIDELVWPGEGTKGGRSYVILKQLVEVQPELAAVARPKAAKWTPTAEERAKILKLRKEGMGYAKIDAELGWPEKKGGRAYVVVKAEENRLD